MNQSLFRTAFLLVLGCLLATSTYAVSVEPGQWDMTVSVAMPMLPTPQQRSFSDCIDETEIDPEDFQMDEDNACTFTDVEESGDTISWNISCPSPGGTSEGSWSFTSNGDSLNGEGSMSMNMNGQDMEFTTTWSGVRTGACTE